MKHTASNKPSNPEDSKTTASGLTNVNVEESKVDPNKFEERLERRPVGAQVFIQFHDTEDNAVGEQISVDSFSNKDDLNVVLAEILREAGLEPEQSHIE